MSRLVFASAPMRSGRFSCSNPFALLQKAYIFNAALYIGHKLVYNG